jgi:ParB family chromosome partitioning protein
MQLAGMATIPAMVKETTPQASLEMALVENIQREDLNPIEEAQAYKKLIETVGLTQEALASRVGRDRSYITNYLRLLRLPEDLQQLLKEGRLSTGHARTLLALTHPDLQRRAARHIIDGGLSVRATEQMVQKMVEEKPAKNRPTARPVDPNVRAAETKLRRALGTQVRILISEQGRGKVEISFFNSQDLDRIYNLLVKSTTMASTL